MLLIHERKRTEMSASPPAYHTSALHSHSEARWINCFRLILIIQNLNYTLSNEGSPTEGWKVHTSQWLAYTLKSGPTCLTNWQIVKNFKSVLRITSPALFGDMVARHYWSSALCRKLDSSRSIARVFWPANKQNWIIYKRQITNRIFNSNVAFQIWKYEISISNMKIWN